MVTIVVLLSCAWVPGQVVDRPTTLSGEIPSKKATQNQHWLLTPRVRPSQELVYRGLYVEKSSQGGAHFERTYRFSNRLFVLTTSRRNLEVAFQTIYRDKDAIPPRNRLATTRSAIRSVRLEKLRVDQRGQALLLNKQEADVPLDGPPLLETGSFTEFPLARITLDRSWIEKENNKPVRIWRALGTEMVNGARCLKLLGIQQSEDWDRPRGDSTAWRRVDQVWIAPQLGVAYRVERVIERRLPARLKPTHRSVLRYELESSLQYPRQLAQDRQQEIEQALQFRKNAEAFIYQPVQYKKQLAALYKQMETHEKRYAPTPYRESFNQVKLQVEAAQRGEIPVALPKKSTSAYTPEKVTQATPGKHAPDFVATDIRTSKLARLKDFAGKPILMVFYRPESRTLYQVMYFAWEVRRRFPDVQVLALAMSDDSKQVQASAKKMRVAFPLLNGTGLRISYQVEGTPKMVLVDANGVVHSDVLGWGPSTAKEALRAVEKMVKTEESTISVPQSSQE